jgi:L-ribulose-5-phosphate 3-epimerase
VSAVEIGVFLSAARTYRPGTRELDVDAACAAVRELGFTTVQLGKLPDEYYAPHDTARLAATLRRHGLTACALTMVYDGESYADYASVQRTVGFMPAERVEERVAFSLRCVDTAAALGVPLVTTHVGLIPSDEADPAYRQVLDATNRVAAHAAARGVGLALETGQESAAELLAFLDALDHPAGVNFDGANFVCYRKDEPLAALRALYPRILGVHVKDYLPPDESRLIRTCPLGQGAARVDDTLAFLLEAGWSGPLVLEVYDEADPIGTIAAARDYLQTRLGRVEEAL